MARQQTEVRELDEGSYVMIEDTPCKIDSYSTAKPGKHGSAKARIDARGVFDSKKRSEAGPSRLDRRRRRTGDGPGDLRYVYHADA